MRTSRRMQKIREKEEVTKQILGQCHCYLCIYVTRIYYFFFFDNTSMHEQSTKDLCSIYYLFSLSDSECIKYEDFTATQSSSDLFSCRRSCQYGINTASLFGTDTTGLLRRLHLK